LPGQNRRLLLPLLRQQQLLPALPLLLPLPLLLQLLLPLLMQLLLLLLLMLPWQWQSMLLMLPNVQVLLQTIWTVCGMSSMPQIFLVMQ
jgi:hypothetical protein